jgi:tRNA (pseudouridine54-N1)-methyltransferase
MQLTVLLDAPKCRTDGDFLIRDVPGTSGRLDVVCRILLSTFRAVPELCPNLQFFAVLGGPPSPPLQLQVQDVTPKSLPGSGLACSLILKGLLQQFTKSKKIRHNQWPEFSLLKKGFAETLKENIPADGRIFYLIEKGTPLEEIVFSFELPMMFVLGDDQGLPQNHEEILYQYKVQEVSIGTRSLLGSQVISLILLSLARRLNAS